MSAQLIYDLAPARLDRPVIPTARRGRRSGIARSSPPGNTAIAAVA